MGLSRLLCLWGVHVVSGVRKQKTELGLPTNMPATAIRYGGLKSFFGSPVTMLPLAVSRQFATVPNFFQGTHKMEVSSTLFPAAPASTYPERLQDPRSFLEYASDRDTFIPMNGSLPIGSNTGDIDWTFVQQTGRGSFGDAWKGRLFVVLKFFYKKVTTNNQTKLFYITKRDTLKDAKLHRAVAQNLKECGMLQDLVQEAFDKNLKTDHLCRCIDEHITDAADSDPLFLVHEDCGVSLDQAKPRDLATIRSVTKQVLEGIDTLSKLAFVHHDLKLGNAAYNNITNHVKLIDFGGMRKFVRENERCCSAYTPSYAPPEMMVNTKRTKNFDIKAPASAFDCYAAGMMYWNMLCRGLVNRKTKPVGCQKEQLGTQEDFNLVASLTNVDPKLRALPEQAIKAIEKMSKASS